MTGSQFTGDDTHPAGAVVMFQLERELTLALYPRSEIYSGYFRDLDGHLWEVIHNPS